MTLIEAATGVLACGDAAEKALASRRSAAAWRRGGIDEIGTGSPPDRPARPARPELLRPRAMPKRRAAGALQSRIALLHALAHIELNAIDLAWDIAARFAAEDLPRKFYGDWIAVADDEAKHFLLLRDRLGALGAAYGDLPAHDGLWQAAEATRHDLLARLAIVPLVLEARGLDVTPTMMARLDQIGDTESAAVLHIIYKDEIGHVAIGMRWFAWLAERRGCEPIATWQSLVREHFRGRLKPPFNDAARLKAGFDSAYYLPIAR